MSTPSTAVDPVLASLVILISGRCATADTTGEATSGVATIKDREVGARFFWEYLQGKVERAGVITKPQGDERENDASQRQVWSTRKWSHDMHDTL
jgi:hypothetical protein